MNQRTIPIGRIWGIPLTLDPSWFLIFILITWTMATTYYPAGYRNWSVATYWSLGAATAVLLFISVILHELGHAMVARRYDIPVNRITLFIFGGVAEIKKEPPTAVSEFWIAIAGPVASILLAGLFGLLQMAFTSISPLMALAKYLAYINGSLALFNLIPGFPLDGGRVLRATLWAISHDFRRATRIAALIGRTIAYIAIIFGVWEIFTGRFGNGVWIAFVGWFLESAAASTLHQQTIQDILMGHRVYEVMHANYRTVTVGTTVQNLIEEQVINTRQRAFIVTRADEPVGLVTLGSITAIPRKDWPVKSVEEVMIPMGQVKRVQPDAGLWSALEEMDSDGVNQLPVMVDNRCLGMLSREDVIGFMRTRRAFSV
jgi:Zn-dependent protease